jgi:hypothetical protein
MALPPVVDGATHCTVADAFPPAAVTFWGGPGAVAGVTAFDGADAGLVPALFVAVTVNE